MFSTNSRSIRNSTPTVKVRHSLVPLLLSGGLFDQVANHITDAAGRGFNTPGPQQFGTSPQQVPHYNNQHRNGGNYNGKPAGNAPQQHGAQSGPAGSATPGQARAGDAQVEAK